MKKLCMNRIERNKSTTKRVCFSFLIYFHIHIFIHQHLNKFFASFGTDLVNILNYWCLPCHVWMTERCRTNDPHLPYTLSRFSTFSGSSSFALAFLLSLSSAAFRAVFLSIFNDSRIFPVKSFGSS